MEEQEIRDQKMMQIFLAIRQENIERLKILLKKEIQGYATNTEVFQYKHQKHGLIASYACGIGNLEIIKFLSEQSFLFDSSSLEEACDPHFQSETVNKSTRLDAIRYLLKEIGLKITPDTIANTINTYDDSNHKFEIVNLI